MSKPNSIYVNAPIQGLIMEVDPDWSWRRIVAKGYEFANGRTFFVREVPGAAYPWNSTNTGGNGSYHSP